MRIGVNCFLLQPHVGGMKTYFSLVFDYLLELDRENTYIFFYFTQNESELAKLRSDRWRAEGILVGSQEEIAQHWDAIDVYFCPFGAVWPRPAPVPSVVTVHDIQEVFFPEFFDPQQRYIRESHYPSSSRAADRVIAVSEYTKRTIVEYHGTAPSRIKVAMQCADPVYFSAGSNGQPRDGSLPFERFVFFPGNRWPHKNHDLLLRALRLLRKERNLTANAVFTGFDVDGGYPLLAKAADYGVADQVRSVGYVTRDQVACLYANAEMLVFPSLFEGFGLPVLEAMAAGCPCALSNAASLPEIGGDAALYFSPTSEAEAADAIARLWLQPELRRDLIERGRRRAAMFSAQRTAEAHLEAFQEAVASFSQVRYRWHRHVYQPWHRWRTDRKYRHLVGTPSSITDLPQLQVSFEKGWHGLEGGDADWLRWCSGVGVLRLHAPEPMTVRLQGESLSMSRPNDIQIELNGRVLSRWREEGGLGGFQPLPAVDLELQKGRNHLRITSGNGPVTSPQDPRPLALAVRNLRFSV